MLTLSANCPHPLPPAPRLPQSIYYQIENMSIRLEAPSDEEINWTAALDGEV